jgi:hypothetical protein
MIKKKKESYTDSLLARSSYLHTLTSPDHVTYALTDQQSYLGKKSHETLEGSKVSEFTHAYRPHDVITNRGPCPKHAWCKKESFKPEDGYALHASHAVITHSVPTSHM